jgi:hypothetical protein
VIFLRSAELAVRVDPRHGAEILDLVDLASGRQLLGRAPFASSEPRAGDLDVDTWTAGYRGGWQLLVPNAGNACEVDGALHGYHGRASNDPWEVLEAASASALVAWSGHGLRVERQIELEDGALSVSTRAVALERRVPLVAAEHVALGLELLDPEVEIGFPGGRAYELSESDGPPEPPPGAPEWPEILLLDGSTERGDRWALERPRSRYYVVTELPEGRATVRNVATGQGLELGWEADWLRHAWVWHEARTYGGPWRGMAEVLAVEPASVPHGLGLAEAVERGHARWLEPGESSSWRVTARPAT